MSKTSDRSEGLPRHDESKPQPIRHRLWWITISPTLWAIHFLVCYIGAAIWCERYAGSPNSLGPLLTLVSVATVVALAGILVIAWLSFKNFRAGDPPLPYDFNDPEDRSHFLGFTAFLLSALSLIATLFTALVFVLVRSCD